VEAANATIMEGVRRNPLFPNHYTNMATNLREIGRLGESMQWLMAYQKLDSTPAFGHIALCKRYLDFGDDQTAAVCFDEAEAKYPKASIGSRVELWQYRLEFPRALKEAELLAERFPNPFAKISVAWNLINNERYEDALKIVREDRPKFLEDEKILIGSLDDLNYAILAGYSEYSNGEKEKGNALLDQALEHIATIHRVRGEGYSELDVTIHVLRGEKQKAIGALRDAIDTGWRDNWWRLRYPFYNSMLEVPDWVELITELEADIAKQRQWFEDHQDDPLF
jgi:tetratricopeptide (TPR) repeat protein